MLRRTLALSVVAPLVAGYSWDFAQVPTQCGTLALNITGNDGKPPFKALVIPYGTSPFGNVEVRQIFEAQFNDTTSLSVPFNFPANSQFIIVVSDQNKFGSGGVSAANTVQGSKDDSCFDKTKSVTPQPFGFNIDPPNQLVQCNSIRVYWQPIYVQGTPYIHGLIPGGDAFDLTYSNPTNDTKDGLGLGFNWTVPISVGTQVVLVAGDNRGYVAGSIQETVSGGVPIDGSCLSNSDPVSTSGTPAGGAYPTSSSSSSSGSSPTSSGDPNSGGSGHHSNVGAIVGGVVGGVVGLLALLLLLLFLRRRRRFHRQQKERPVDLINDADDTQDGQLPQYYRPDPFVLPDPSVAGGDGRASMHEAEGAALLGAGAAAASGRPSNASTHSFAPPGVLGAAGRPGTPDRRASAYGSSAGGSSSARKGGAPAPLRPVNIIQHDDGGRVPDAQKDEDGEGAETIELPPAYTNIRRGPSTRVPNVEHAPDGPESEEAVHSGPAPSESAETSAVTAA